MQLSCSIFSNKVEFCNLACHGIISPLSVYKKILKAATVVVLPATNVAS